MHEGLCTQGGVREKLNSNLELKSLWWKRNLLPKGQVCACAQKVGVFSVEIGKNWTQSVNWNFYSSVRLKYPLEPNTQTQRHFKPGALFCGWRFSVFLCLHQAAAEADAGCACRFKRRCCARRVCVCTDSSHVTSLVSGASCGPARGNAISLCSGKAAHADCSSSACEAKGKSEHDTVSVEHIIATVRAGPEMWSETKHLVFDHSWAVLAEPLWRAGPPVTSMFPKYFLDLLATSF